MLNSHRQMESFNDSRNPLRLPSDNFEGGSPQQNQTPKSIQGDSPQRDMGSPECDESESGHSSESDSPSESRP